VKPEDYSIDDLTNVRSMTLKCNDEHAQKVLNDLYASLRRDYQLSLRALRERANAS